MAQRGDWGLDPGTMGPVPSLFTSWHPGLKWVRGESPRPLTPWTRQVSGAGLASPMSPGPRQGQAQNPGPEAGCALQGLPTAGWRQGPAVLASDPEGLEQLSQEPRGGERGHRCFYSAPCSASWKQRSSVSLGADILSSVTGAPSPTEGPKLSPVPRLLHILAPQTSCPPLLGLGLQISPPGPPSRVLFR